MGAWRGAWRGVVGVVGVVGVEWHVLLLCSRFFPDILERKMVVLAKNLLPDGKCLYPTATSVASKLSCPGTA